MDYFWLLQNQIFYANFLPSQSQTVFIYKLLCMFSLKVLAGKHFE